MANFSRSKFGGGRSFGKRDFGGNRPRPQMHNAICSDCGRECQVPFNPTGDKPVYCRDCFAKHNGGDFKKNFERNDRNDGPRSQPMGDQQLQAINNKLDKILALLAHGASNEAEVAQRESLSTETQPQATSLIKGISSEKPKRSPKKVTKPSVE